jgi:diaminohydroxyphosphoribosylaminopyrimidine deaminase/5-amino-6-(5-phosphoribosylamino)uracil reductase
MTAFSAIDHAHMARALRLAERGLYTTQPNPRVGCVIAHADQIAGEGWHRRAGEAHAEVNALRAAGDRARGATAYVTLEPCGLHGRTPPCADVLIAAGVARVVIASDDAFQRAGDALARMRAAGLVVESGLMRDAARELNRGFFSRVERERPWLRVKLAMSLDGRTALANGESKWITGEAARADVQHWRARSSAILTGSGTVLADNPRMTVRASLGPLREAPLPFSRREKVPKADEGKANQDEAQFQPAEALPSSGAACPLLPRGEGEIAPLRVVLDRELRTPQGAHILDGSAPTLIFHAPGAMPAHADFDRAERIAVETQGDRLNLSLVLRILAQRGMNEVQVEAGPTLCGAFLQSGFVDELLLYIAPVLLGDKARPLLVLPDLHEITQAKRLRVVDQRQVGSDLRILYRE